MTISSFQHKSRFGILLVTSLLVLFCLIPVAKAHTRIGNSIVPVEEGDSYKWILTYSINPPEVGNWMNITIKNIYQGSYMSIPHALIINATLGGYIKQQNLYLSGNAPEFLVYNATLKYLYFDGIFPFITPIPLNLTIIKNFIEMDWGYTCTIAGNVLIVDEGIYFPGRVKYFTFNTGGFLTSIKYTENEIKQKVYTIEGDSSSQIPFGNYYFILTFLAMVSVMIYVRKHITK